MLLLIYNIDHMNALPRQRYLSLLFQVGTEGKFKSCLYLSIDLARVIAIDNA